MALLRVGYLLAYRRFAGAAGALTTAWVDHVLPAAITRESRPAKAPRLDPAVELEALRGRVQALEHELERLRGAVAGGLDAATAARSPPSSSDGCAADAGESTRPTRATTPRAQPRADDRT